MEKFSKKQPGIARNSVDGILGSDSFARQQKGLETDAQEATTLSRGRLDDFSGPDGFRAAKQPTLKASHAFDHHARRPKRNAKGKIDLSLTPAPKKTKKKRNWKKRALRGFVGFSVILVLIFGFLFGKGYLKLHNIFKGGTEGAAALQDDVDPSRLRGEGDGRVNILLLGRGGEGQTGPDLTDTILIASIDPINKKAALLSVPRDLYYPKTSNYRVNSVFAEAKYAALARKASKTDAENAGFTAIEKVIQDDLGIPIHYHVMMDFAGFVQAINTVGGVDINVDEKGVVYERLWDSLTRKNYILDVKQGQQHFDGQRALYYARSRKTSSRGDFDRAERQRKLLIALKEKILSLGTFANPIKISQLLDAFGNHVQANMSINEVMRLYEIGKEINSDEIATLSLVDPPNNLLTSVNISGQSIQRPKAGLNDFSEIQSFVRNQLKDGFIAKENASIVVLNGTSSSGLAAKRTAELKSYGYNVIGTGDAPTKNYKENVIVSLRGDDKKYTRHYLELRFGVKSVSSLPSGVSNDSNADFVIIVGQ